MTGKVVGFAVTDALGECYAITSTRAEADKARSAALSWLNEAEMCGHPSAPAWVAKRLPVKVQGIDAATREVLLDEGTPVLDREP